MNRLACRPARCYSTQLSCVQASSNQSAFIPRKANGNFHPKSIFSRSAAADETFTVASRLSRLRELGIKIKDN